MEMRSKLSVWFFVYETIDRRLIACAVYHQTNDIVCGAERKEQISKHHDKLVPTLNESMSINSPFKPISISII